MGDEFFVKNIGDSEQVKKAKDKIKLRRENELADIKFILSSQQGRRFIWRLLSGCKVFESIYEINSNHTYYKSGMQDIGHFIMAEICEADEKIFIKMMEENYGVKL